MTKSDVTKSYRVKYWLCAIGSWLITFAPMLVYLVMAFVKGSTTSKLALGMICIAALILVAINALLKLHLRCTLWLLLLGIYFCLSQITILLFIVAIGTAVDEIILTPLAKKYKNQYTINKEIDKRGTNQEDRH